MCWKFPIQFCFFAFCAVSALLNLGFMVLISVPLFTNHSSQAFTAIVVLIVLCLAVFLFSALGFFGAAANSYKLSFSYTIILIVIVLGKIVLYIKAFRPLEASDEATVALERNWKMQKEGKNTMDEYQRVLKCCGVDGPYDYIENNMTVPASCQNKQNQAQAKRSDKVYKIGCRAALIKLTDRVAFWLTVFFWICLTADLLALRLAITMTIKLWRKRKDID